MSASLWRRLQQTGERRLPSLTRYRHAEPLPIVLHRRRIYILPTGFGVAFSVLLLVMLVGALNYANNAALLLTCLLGAASAASMLVAFRNLDGLQLKQIQAARGVAGDPLELSLTFVAPRASSAIRLELDTDRSAFAVAEMRPTSLRLPLSTDVRGWQPLPRIKLWSSWPLGLFRAWSWLHPDLRVLVWPRPEAGGPPPPEPADPTARARLRQGEDVAALRNYRAGDPLRHIAWKASARHVELVSREFEQPQAQPAWRLDWRDLAGLDGETRIARLARWLNEAHEAGRRFSLWLPGEDIPAGAGAGHHLRCMDALAALP